MSRKDVQADWKGLLTRLAKGEPLQSLVRSTGLSYFILRSRLEATRDAPPGGALFRPDPPWSSPWVWPMPAASRQAEVSP